MRSCSAKQIFLLLCLLSGGLLLLAPAQTPVSTSAKVRTPLSARRRKPNKQVKAKPVSQESAPPSRFHKEVRIDESDIYRLPPQEERGSEGEVNQGKSSKRLQIGVIRDIQPPLDPLLDAKWFDLERNQKVGVMAIASEGARQIRVRFEGVNLPPRAKLFVYSTKNREEIYGPYVERGPSGTGVFWSPPVEGEGAVIEYVVGGDRADTRPGATPFKISQVSHVFQR